MENLNIFVIDEATRAFMTSSNKARWYTNQIENLSIKVDGEEIQKKDAHGNLIANIVKGKTCEVGFDVSVLDLGVLADANGTELQTASATNKLTSTAFDEFEITGSTTDITLKNTPVDDIVYVQTLNPDGSLKKAFTVGAAVADGVATYTKATKKVTFNSGDIVAGDTVLVVYDYEVSTGSGFSVSAKDVPKVGKLYIEVKGYNICDKETVLYAYYRFPQAQSKVSNQQDIKVDSTFHIDYTCAVSYCDKKQKFYDLIIPGVSEGE